MSTAVSLTPRAVERIKDIVGGEPGKPYLRVSVAGGGCSGFSYEFDLDGERAEDDLVIERDGAGVLIDPVSLAYLLGAESTSSTTSSAPSSRSTIPTPPRLAAAAPASPSDWALSLPPNPGPLRPRHRLSCSAIRRGRRR
jgi:iron-sulfur cluster insertion protein